MLNRLRTLWWNVARRREADAALDAELRAYVDLLAAEHERRGLSPVEARRAALIETGGVEQVKERTRDAWLGAFVVSAMRELRHTTRSLRRAPLFVVVVVLTLAIAIGSATALFTIIKGSLLRPLPAVAQPERLVSIEPVRGGTTLYDFGYPDFVDYRDQATTLSGLALYDGTSLAFRDSVGTGNAWVSYVSGEFFDVLGVRAAAGRLLVPGDVVPGTTNAVVVIGYEFWQRHFAGSPRAIGATIRLDGYPVTVIGVAPKGFIGAMALHEMEMWIPLTIVPAIFQSTPAPPSRADATGRLIGRLAPRRTVEDARRELIAIAARLALAYPEDKGRTVRVDAGAGMTVDERTELARLPLLLSAAVTLLLLIACANVANLSLVRAAARRRELATRLALGATRTSLVGILALESGLLAAASAALGLGLARLLVRWSVAVQNVVDMSNLDLSLDRRVLAVSIGCAMLTMVLVSIAPALETMRVPVGAVLKNGGGGAVRRRSRGQRALVAAQVAASLVLLMSCAVVFGAAQRTLAANPGFGAEGVTTAYLNPHEAGLDSIQQVEFYRAVLERAQAHPAISAAGLANTVPPAPWVEPSAVYRRGEEPPLATPDSATSARFRVFVDRVSPGTLEALAIPLLVGRTIAPTDVASAEHVVIVSRRMADAIWPNENPIGRLLVWPDRRGTRREPMRVVGVVGDIAYAGLTKGPVPTMYVPLAQQPVPYNLTLVMRGRGGALVPDSIVRSFVQATAPALRVSSGRLSARMQSEVGPQRRASAFMGAFGAVALLLAALGLYGIVAQRVQQRRRELAVRAALGASPSALLTLVLSDGLVLTATGTAIGMIASILSVRVLRAMYAGLDSIDIGACAAAMSVLAVAALAATYLPARRAAALDVMEALRTD